MKGRGEQGSRGSFLALPLALSLSLFHALALLRSLRKHIHSHLVIHALATASLSRKRFTRSAIAASVTTTPLLFGSPSTQ